MSSNLRSTLDPSTEDTQAGVDDAMVTNEEYKIWKKNSPFLYDLVLAHALEWPSLTAQWLPDQVPASQPGVNEHHILLGTHTSGQAKDHLLVARAQLPVGVEGGSQVDGPESQTQPTDARVRVVQRILHDGEVNRARHNPLNPSLIATQSISGSVYIFNRDTHPSEPIEEAFQPNLTLQGQEREGYGLAWSSVQNGLVLGASEDTAVRLWDISAAGGRTTLDPNQTFRGHTAYVEDCAFDPSSATRFASVGDDRQLLLWDTRVAPDQPTDRVEAGTGEINTVAWNAFVNGHVLATGGSDKVVRLWDIRALAHPVHALEAHTSEVLGLAFSPTEPTILASSAADKRVNIWDLSRIGSEQDPADAEDGPAELMFQHGGHTAQPTDLSWAPNDPWHLVTAAEDNVLQLWRPNRTLTDEFEAEQNGLE